MNKNRVPGQKTIIFLLLLFAAAVLATAVVILINNSVRSAPFFLFITFTGIGLILALDRLWGGLAALLMLFLWVILKKGLGTWEDVSLLTNGFELASILLVFGLTALFTGRLRMVLEACYSSLNRLEQLDVEDKQVGLIKPAIGRLRLQEEEERSVRYKRPFSLVLIQVQPNSERDFSAAELAFYVRIVGNIMKSTTRKTDIPFLAAPDKIAIILPETELKGADKVVKNIMRRMHSGHFMESDHTRVFLQERVQIRYGFAAFTGVSQVPIQMLEAAENSLQAVLARQNLRVFQNLTTKWEMVGDQPLPTTTVNEMLRATAHYIGVDPIKADVVIEAGVGRPNGTSRKKVDTIMWQLSMLIKEVRPDGQRVEKDGIAFRYHDTGQLHQ
jgi:hypothetical protein